MISVMGRLIDLTGWQCIEASAGLSIISPTRVLLPGANFAAHAGDLPSVCQSGHGRLVVRPETRRISSEDPMSLAPSPGSLVSERFDAIFASLPPPGSPEYLAQLRQADAPTIPAQVLVRAFRQLRAAGQEEAA